MGQSNWSPPPPPPNESPLAPIRKKVTEFVGYGRETRGRQLQFTEPARLREEAANLRLSAARNRHRAARLETSMERHHHAAAELESKRLREQQRLEEMQTHFEGQKDRTPPTAAESEPDSPQAPSVDEARSRLQRQKYREKIAAQQRKVAAVEHRIAEHRTAAENRRALAQQLEANAKRDEEEAQEVERRAQESKGPQEAPAPKPSPRFRT
jgi:hypothetical protein